jgi:hypothetical protein
MNYNKMFKSNIYILIFLMTIMAKKKYNDSKMSVKEYRGMKVSHRQGLSRKRKANE